MSVLEQAKEKEETPVPGIERVPGVCGGYPVIAGTRISVRHVVEDLRVNRCGIKEYLQSFPHLSEQQVEAALVYYARYPEIVEEDIRTNREAWEALTGTTYDGDPVIPG
jgi:uncharacterized protein (DUF433 family)